MAGKKREGETDPSAEAGSAQVGTGRSEADPGAADRSETAAGRRMTPERLLEFEAIRNSIYHQSKEARYASFHRWLLFIVVASGSAAVAGGTEAIGIPVALTASIAALAGLADIVFDFFGKASQHAQLRWRAMDVLAELKAGQTDLAVLEGRLARLLSDEPPEDSIANRRAYNRAVEALGLPDKDKYEIPSGIEAFLTVFGWPLEWPPERKKTPLA